MGIQSSIPTLERNGAVWLAGEASGDFIASLVIPEVAARMGGAPQYGVGGDKMRASFPCAAMSKCSRTCRAC